MNKALRNWAAALIAAVAAPIIAAGAQQEDFGRRWPQEAPAPVPQIPPRAAQQNPPAAEPGTNPPPAARPSVPRPDIAGTWSGTVTQVGGESKYTVVLTLTGNAGQTDYPELNCGGKLTRIGASHTYVFFVEVITHGQVDKGGRCPDGTITVARAGDNLNPDAVLSGPTSNYQVPTKVKSKNSGQLPFGCIFWHLSSRIVM